MARRDLFNLAVVLFVGVLIGVAYASPDPDAQARIPPTTVTAHDVRALTRALNRATATTVPPRLRDEVADARGVLSAVTAGNVIVAPDPTTTAPPTPTPATVTTPPPPTTTTTTAPVGSRENPVDFDPPSTLGP